MKTFIAALTLLISLASTVYAGDLITAKGKTLGRDNHSFIYEEKDACKTCHVNAKKNTNDAACVECHGTISTIDIDTSRLVNAHANPHKSVHYGEAISCIACHAEHKVKTPLCSECHRTWFREM